MKKKNFSIVLFGVMTICLVACGNATKNSSSSIISETNNESIVEQEITEENSEGEMVENVHEHNYVENVVKEATCTENGAVSYVCECGDAYDEEVEAKGHNFGDYVSDDNASYTADGTKTAKCSSCETTDTVADEGSKLSYTYTDGEAVKYAQQTVNLRSGPSTDFDKIGSLSTNDEVKVVATCNETGWYKIVWNGSEAYVSNNYLGDKKVEPPAPAPADNGNSGGNVSSGVPRAADYPLGVWHNMGDYSFYVTSEWDWPDGCDGGGFHINDGSAKWCWMKHYDKNNAAMMAFIEANVCKCGEPTHGGTRKLSQ